MTLSDPAALGNILRHFYTVKKRLHVFIFLTGNIDLAPLQSLKLILVAQLGVEPRTEGYEPTMIPFQTPRDNSTLNNTLWN